MTLKDEITAAVKKIFADQWTTRDGAKVPEAENLVLGNEAVKLDGTVLYADLAGSTDLVDKHKPFFAAEMYKTYLYAAARIIRSEGGVIVAYDGDRVMALFIGDMKSTSAVRCALKNIVQPLKDAQYAGDAFKLRQVVGVDTGQLWAARTGVRGANDLVWVGPAANYAAKLTELDTGHATWITHRVYDAMSEQAKKGSSGEDMWEAQRWRKMNNLLIYRSNYWWSIT